MIATFVFLFILIAAILAFLYVAAVHAILKKEYESKNWMDNSEYDYGHDVRYNEEDNF